MSDEISKQKAKHDKLTEKECHTGKKKMYMAHFQIEKKVLVTENTTIYTPQLNTKIKHKFNIYIYSTIKKNLKSVMSGHHKNQYRPFHH